MFELLSIFSIILLMGSLTHEQANFEVLFQNQSISLLGLKAPMNRFEAIDKCRDDQLGQLVGTRSQQMNENAKSWIHKMLTSSESEMKFHLDITVDDSIGVIFQVCIKNKAVRNVI